MKNSFNKIVLIVLISTSCVTYVSCVLNPSSYNSVTLFDCSVEDLRGIKNISAHPQNVSIQHCHLGELPNALFIRFPQMKVLEICDSRLNHLQDYALNGLKALELLNLSKNNLTQMKSWSEHDLNALQILDLRRNQLREINKSAFKHYPNLTRLNLAVNQIDTIGENCFKHTANLKYLNLGKNLLTSIDETTFKGLHKLSHLALHHNRISYIDFFAFVSNTHLKSLQLQDNEISIFEVELLSNLPRLVHLNISKNSLLQLSENTFMKNMELKTLDISYNKFSKFHEDTFKGLEVLEIFNASNNDVQYLNKYIFKDFSNVKYFDFSKNNLTTLANNLFEYMSNVEHLNLSKNGIQEIEPDVFMATKRLRQLDLAGNQLQNDGFLWPIIGLKNLNLSSNLFRSFNTSVLEDLDDVELKDNPWNCKWLLTELSFSSHRMHFGNLHNMNTLEPWNQDEISGIDCAENGRIKSIIVLETANMDSSYLNTEDLSYRKYISENRELIRPPSDFDFKSIFLWLSIGVYTVVGITSLMRFLMRKSERNSDKLRLSQQVGLPQLSSSSSFEIEEERKLDQN